MSGRLASQLHQPDGDALLGDLLGVAAEQRRRPLSLGSEHHPPARRDRRGAVRGCQLPRRRRQPPSLHPALRARRREPLSAARRGDRAGPRASPARAGADLSHLRLLSHRVEPALGRVRALVHAPRLGDRADVDPGLRLRSRERREPRRVRAQPQTAGRRRGVADRALGRVRAADHPLDRHRPAADRVRQRREHRPDREPPGRRLRRGPLRGRFERPPADPRRRSCRRSWRRSTGPSSTSAN